MRCPHVLSVRNPKKKSHSDGLPYFIEVPCGRCAVCRHNRQVEWAFRLQCESLDSSSALFITLTYNDETCPVDSATGLRTLRKRDAQLFIKTLRNHYPDCNLRYFLVGEYGSHTCRPHYHLILFNLPFVTVKDAQKIIEKLWKRGFVHVGGVTHGSVAYCAKYSNKVHLGNDHEFPVDEFMLCSTKPPIGIGYVTRYSQRHMQDPERSLCYSAYSHKMPRVFKKRLTQIALDMVNDVWLEARERDAENFMSSADCFIEWRLNNPTATNYNPYHEEEMLIKKLKERREREKF